MKKIDDPFTAFYPYIDLHGLTKIEAIVKTNEFINDNIKLRNFNIIIIHGKGSGILKEGIHEFLKKDKRVIEFKTDNFNDGITIVKIEGEKMENKKGFTLVELLSVIALLGVLLLLVLPNVTKSFQSAKKSLFKDEVINIYNSAFNTYILNTSEGDFTKRFCVGNDTTTKELNVDEKENFYYDVLLNNKGEVIYLKVSNENYGFFLNDENGIKKKNIKTSNITENFIINCNE